MKIKVEQKIQVIGGNDEAFYNFPSAELLNDGSFFICARKIRSLSDSKGDIVAVRYFPKSGVVRSVVSPIVHDKKANPDKGYLMCHVTQISDGQLIAIYSMIDSDEEKPLFSPDNDGMQNAVCRLTYSKDNGNSWAQPEDLSYTIADLIIPSKIQVMKNGVIGFPVETHNRYGEDYKEPIQARFIYSVDGGKNFDRATIIPHQKDLLAGDARCTFDNDGNMIVFYWGYDMANMVDLAVHRTHTTDEGKTFAVVSQIDLKKQITSPFYIDENCFLCIYQERFSENPGIKAMLSCDGGFHFDEDTQTDIITFEGIPDTENPFTGFEQYKFGYSTLTRINQKEALATFWHSCNSGTCISVCRISVEDN